MMSILLLLVIGVSLGLEVEETNSVVDCPPDFINFPDPYTGTPHCLFFATDLKRKWAEVKDHCRVIGSDLADLDVTNLHHQVALYLREHSSWANEGFFIGGTDEEFEGNWVWSGTGKQMKMYTPHWYLGQPDNEREENYCCILPPGHFYHSCANEGEYYAICQL